MDHLMETAPKISSEKTSAFDQVPAFRFLDRFFARIETWLNLVGVTFILILMIMTAAEIFGRYVFNHPIPGYVENTELIMAAIVFLGFGYTQRVRAHIRMDMIINRLKGRIYHAVETVSALLGLVAYGIILISSFKVTLDAYHMGDVTEYLYTPTWPSKLCVPLGALFLCIRFFLQAMKNLGQVISGVEIRDLE